MIKSFLRSPKRFIQSYWRFKRGDKVGRWQPQESLHDSWKERTQIMAGMIAPGSSVLEFGAGKEHLRSWLPEGCDYQPSDLVARSEQTLVFNLNEGFPALSKHYDVIVLSGVIEYIYDLPALFLSLRAHCNRCIVSYAPLDRLSCIITRWNCDFVNHHTHQQLFNIFAKACFELEEQRSWTQQTIYHLR